MNYYSQPNLTPNSLLMLHEALHFPGSVDDPHCLPNILCQIIQGYKSSFRKHGSAYCMSGQARKGEIADWSRKKV